MRFADPATLICPVCDHSQSVGVAELLALNARCSNCQASLRENGERMHALTDKVLLEWLPALVVSALPDVYRPVRFTDDVWTAVSSTTTKDEFTKALAKHLASVTSESAAQAAVREAFEQVVTKYSHCYQAPMSESSPLTDMLAADRREKHVAMYTRKKAE